MKSFVKFRELNSVSRFIIFATLFGLIFILLGDYLLWFDLSAADKVNSAVLLITAAAIFYYTKETFDLKKIQQTQYEYENMPYFKIQWSNNNDEILKIVNAGKGIAIEVTFENIVLKEGPIQTPIIIKRRPAFSAGGVSTVGVEEIREKSEKDKKFDLRGYVDIKLKSNKFPDIHMVYMDLLGTVYDAVFEPDELYNDRFKIKSQKRR